MDILTLKYLCKVCQIPCLFGPQFHYVYNYKGELADFEELYPIIVCNSVTTQLDIIILFIHTFSIVVFESKQCIMSLYGHSKAK